SIYPMPKTKLFGRKFNFSTDNQFILSSFDIIIRLSLLITYIVFRTKYVSTYNCVYLTLYYIYVYLLIACYSLIILTRLIIIILSIRGTPMNQKPRRAIPLFIYIRLMLMFIEFGICIIGLVVLSNLQTNCRTDTRTLIIVTFVFSLLTLLRVLFSYLIFVDKSVLFTPEQKWKARIKLLFCCCSNPFSDQQNDAMKNILQILMTVFENSNLDIVPSDILCGLVLVQEEDVSKLRKVNSTGLVDLDLLTEISYYYDYALAPYGWYLIAYNYRLTWLFRTTIAMKHTYIGCCVTCCCPCITCPCVNAISPNDLCGHQHASLKYLLRERNVEIIYSNFINSLHRIPFFVAIDKTKKMLIISIRGTMTQHDVLTDIHAFPVYKEYNQFKGHIHRGMLELACFIHDDINRYFNNEFPLTKEKYNDYGLILTGYSLGSALIYKNEYPNLNIKCYGLAMPGSVFSSDLAQQTESFIYSVVVDLDLISRASYASIMILHNRIKEALINCQKSKASVLTKTLAKTILSKKTKNRIIPQEELPNNYEEQPTLNRTESKHISAIVQRKDERLYLPGRIIHFYSTRDAAVYSRYLSYKPRFAQREEFLDIIVHPRMILDHFPVAFRSAINYCVENYQSDC
ncbi:unnamed protein product, partial [Didymodactylos carnosus]